MQERFSSIALALFAVGSVAALLSAQAVSVAQPGSVSFPNDIDPILNKLLARQAAMGELTSRELRGGTRGDDRPRQRRGAGCIAASPGSSSRRCRRKAHRSRRWKSAR
jgi:hypothetical protein